MKMHLKLSVTLARWVLGGLFLLFGLNGFLQFLPAPPLPEAAGAFVMALAATGYMFPLVKGIEILAALLLLGNRFVPLALLLLAPLLVNILAFHLFLAPAGLVVPLIVVAAELYLAWAYRAVFAPLLRPSVASAEATGVAANAGQSRALA